MSLFHLIVGVFCLTSLVTSEYNPLKDPNICGLPTCRGTGKFKYAAGTQQTYKYSVEVRSLFNGTSKNESRLYVEGTATLAFLTPCDGLLTLADIKLSENIPRDGSESSEHANTRLFADMITEYSLRFSFKDGVISELCPKEDEKEWVLNFKRGILSMLHNSMKRLDLDHSGEELDVRGSCPTDYRVIGVKETSLLIEKCKDLDRCRGNSKLHSSIKSEHMRMSRSNTNNILKSSSRCTLSIDHNIYKDIKCEERYLLQPFSNFNEGAVTTVSQQLTLLEETKEPMTDDNEITKRTPLTFDHAISTKPTHDDSDASRDLIKQLCKQYQMPDRMDMSDLFGKFIHNLRLLSYSALTELHGKAGAICPRGNKHLLDALPYVSTSGSVALMRDIIVEKTISKDTINEWMYSIGFIANPDEDMMEVAWNLLEGKTSSPHIALGIASLTRTYCSQHSDCRSTNAVDSIVDHLENHFLQLYRSNNIDRNIHDQIMVTLKALSNTGVISEDFQQELFKVIEDSNLDVGIRVGAVETFRRTSCEDTRSYFEERFRDQDEDVEVRIASYLQIMKCPTYFLIRTIRHSLMNEEVNQVGSFVWTHLKNLLTTANPSKVEVQSLLSDKDLVKKFDSDLRKFSRNYEGSMYFDEYDIGGNYESNVIFSPSSYIPKSAMLNLTVDLFGEAVNIMEVYGRMDGLEHYMESFFGPKGTSETLKDNIMDKLRWPRSVKNNEIIKSQVEKLPNVMSNVHNEPKVALGFKIFGNDADYATFNGDSEIRAAIQTLDPVYHLKRILSGEEINYNRAAMFLDGKYVIPSGAGLPLSLTATGTASINIKLYGSLDAAGFSKDKELELDLTADIQPSVSVDLTGEMSVDAFYATTGIKLKTNMYTDSTIQGEVKVRGYKLASLNLSLPKKKNEIFVAKSEILVKQQGVDHPQKGMSSNRFSKSMCSWPVVDQTIGLKVCTEYSFMNVTKMTNIPYFLAAGPANFRCYLQKSDPTANNYSFEYKLTQRRDLSVVSLTFDTPGSTVNRLLSANLTIDRQSQNLTLFLQSSAGTVLARGRYKNTPDEKFVEVALDINNRKHFDASASLKRHHIKNGFSYTPNVYLGVNGERVFRISGNIDLMSKKGISQYSVDLKFETKRFNSRLYGYISKSESSLEASLYNDYKFLGTKEQRVTLMFGAADRSHKNLVVFEGFYRLASTAYPNMNFAANATFQNIGGHTDLTIKVHQNPLSRNHPEADFNTLKFELLLSSKVYSDNKRIFRAVTTLNRKSSNLDLKGEFIYETFRHNITTAMLVKYGRNKEVSVTIFWSHPRTALEQIKTHVNVTIPSFTPMILKLEIVEKSKKDYMINFSGTWFSGHRMSAVGFYQDKSTSLASDHHVKLLLRSPNFRDINIAVQFHRDNDVLKLDLKALHNNRDEYEFFLIHQTVSKEETKNQIHVKYINQLYRYVGSVYDGDYKRVNADIHIDQLRDIVFSVYIYNQADNKSLGFDINWDANRDPDQKLMISANYEKFASFDYIANFIVSYPGRTIKGDYKFLLERRHLETLASLSWDDGKTLAIDMDILYEYDKRLYLEIDTKLNTPFDNWRIMKLDGSFEHVRNKYDLRGIMSWDRRQRITVDLFGDYTSKDSYFTCKYSCSIVSSSDKLPNINTTISHTQNETNFDTNLHLMYNPEFVIGAESQWKIDSNYDSTNLTGTLRSQTPFKGMKNAVLVGMLMMKNKNYIRGAAQLDMDHKKIDLDMEGYFKRLTNCRLVFNATSPEEKYQLRFIVSTEKRTFVAMVNYPTRRVGTEIVLSMNSITNFDVIFHLATPIPFLQEVIIVAKLKPEEADFRLGWNSLLLGFAGVWHYANVTDFEYSYKIYTPIDDFEENGIVGKLILKEGLDFEVSIKLSNYKLGAKLLGTPKPKPLRELGIKLKNIYKTSELSQEEGKDSDDPFSWKGLIELDIIIYPTMKGELEIDQKGNSYILLSKLTMPNGVAHIVDEFEFIDILKMKNFLEITTPYQSFKTIESNFDLTLEAGHLYVFALNFDYKNRTELTQTGVSAKYIVERRGAEERIYNVTLKVNTPFKAFPKLNLFGAFETEENFYHTKLLFNTNRSDISVDATTEIDNGSLELTSQFHVTTPSVYIPVCQLRLTKLFSRENNNLEVNLQIPEKLRSGIHFKTSWLIKSRSEFRSTTQLDTPFAGLENTTAGVDVYISNARSTVRTILQMSPLEVEVNAELENGILTAKSDLNFNGARYPVTVDCKILKPSKNRREFDGNLKFKDKLFIITGSADLIGNIPARVSTKFSPEDNSSPLMFEYQLSPTSLDRYELVGRIQHGEKFARFSAHLTSVDVFDWELQVQIDTSNNEKFIVNTKSSSDENSVTLDVDAYTPIPKLENPKLGARYVNKGLQKHIHGFFDLSNAKGNATVSFIWVYLENMYLKTVGRFQHLDYSSESLLEAFYENPQKTFYTIKAGGDMKIDRLWDTGTNITLSLPPEKKMELEAHLKLPDENKETYSLFTNLGYTKNLKNIDYLLKYRTSYTMMKHGIWGKISTEDKENLSGNIEVEWNSKRFNNFANLKRSEKTLDLIYKLKSPKFIDRQLLVTEIKYKSLGDHHNLTCEAFYPEDRSVAYGTVDYKELANMNGMFNITIPHRSLKYTGAYFNTKTNAIAYNRYIKVFWDGDNAVLDSMCDIKTGATLLDRNMKGKLIIELPLQTRHIALVDYEYDKNAQVSVGDATVKYNGMKVVEGKYNCLSESRAELDKDTVHLEILNEMLPVGADYVYKHQYYAVLEDGNAAPTTDNRYLHLYHPKDRSKFSVNGELNIRTTWSGQEYIITANHANRTIKFLTDYDVLDKKYKQHSRLELSPSHWIEYDLNLFNRTLDEIFDAQQAVINVIYPRRSFTAQGFYNISDSIVSTDVSLVWDKDNKTVRAGLDWRRASTHREQLLLQIKHPSFERDVSFHSEYGYNKSTIDGQLVVDYSLNPDQKLTLGGKVNDNSNSLTYNYTYNVWAEHNATNLNLNSRGDFYWNPSAFGTEHITNYQRSYLPLSTSETLARVNMDHNEIELKKDNIASGKSYFWGKYDGKYPVYTANMSAVYDMNDTRGEFYINFDEKLLYSNVNMTEDGSQSMHMYGIIPDARRAMCDIWRDYEDKRVSDVSYYLRLNHSRLIMSSLRWRPDLISDVQNNIRETVRMFYIDTLEGVNNTKQYVKAEALDALNGIWMEARPFVQNFISDLRNLTVIEDDIEELKVFLNKSYHANEFYIRDIVSTIKTVFDETLKSHLQSLPKIVQEIWAVLGNSGEKIRNSVLWVIEKIKIYYQNTTEFIHGLINGDPIEHLSSGLDKLLEKYDKFMKDLHVTVIKYMENVWAQMSTLVIEHWHTGLASIEPTFLKFIHYLETIVWNTGKEFLDFLYERKSEIIESPFFVQFTKFSHDVDTFYKDITGNNTIASIYKYSEIAWEFLTEKYLNVIPFGKELLDIATEIVTELKQIGDIPSVRYFVDRWKEVYQNIRYYYEYFDLQGRIHGLIKLIYVKISEMSVTALENENRYRKAKTNFIFEPNDGIMLLEQKLPMSWHAFNETPKFKEIPEIKRVYDLLSYLEVAQISFWNLYYDYKLFTDPSEWMPPFKGYAMLAGSSHYVTFDKTYYDFQGKCTYLLATDFIDRNFTLLSSNDVGDKSELILILNKQIVRINLFKNKVLIGESGTERLPAQIGETFLYRNAGMFMVESSLGFVLECNMKFHTCVFKISGWYFGRTAGLWGTFNNEPSDDFLTSKKVRASRSDLSAFGDSWALEKSCKNEVSKKVEPIPREVAALCEEFFTSKVSQLSTCFPRIPKDSFLSMCLKSRSEQEACMSAVSYINLCSYANTPLRIPDTCVKCNLLNGTEMREGNITRLHGSDVPRSADIVFIIEAKECNKNLRKSKNFEMVVELLEKELRDLNIKNNKYAVVVFGGSGVYEEPRSIIVDGNTFADSRSILSYFDNIPAGNGSSDIFNGIMFAYNLIFRPGVSRNFVLVPCSECNKYNMLYDYSTIHQLLSESAISFHILMKDQFKLQKDREAKISFGIDRRLAYTKRDVRGLTGDQPLRKSIILPKSTLGLCLSLAMETNGTVFSGKLLADKEKKNAKKVATVFAKRVARSASPMQCVDCECTAGNTGVSFMECYLCTMSSSSIRYSPETYGMDEEDDLSTNFFDTFGF